MAYEKLCRIPENYPFARNAAYAREMGVPATQQLGEMMAPRKSDWRNSCTSEIVRTCLSEKTASLALRLSARTPEKSADNRYHV